MSAELVAIPNFEEPPDPDRFFKDKDLVVSRLGTYVKEAGHIRVGVDGRLWRYHHGVYRPDGDLFTRVTVRSVLGAKCKSRHFTEVEAWLSADFPTVTDRPPEQWLNVRNGLLDWRTGTLEPHTPDVVSCVQFPALWRPDATCPAIDQFLHQVAPEDAVDLIYELAGYTLYAGNPMRRALLLLGSGRNGKSTLLRLFKALIGDANLAAIPLQLLAENRFAAAELFGKVANIAGDLDARAVRQTDIFKMATGGDPIMAERKNCHPFTFTPFATFLFSANEAPISSDQTDAWFDRWIIIPFDRRIPDDQVIPDVELDARLTTPDELAGFLNRAVHGLQNLMDRGRFDLPTSVDDAGDAYRDRLDTVRGFVSEACVITPDAWVAKSNLYSTYRTWAKASGRLPVSAATFNDHLSRNHAGSLEIRRRRGYDGWAGLGLLADPNQEERS